MIKILCVIRCLSQIPWNMCNQLAVSSLNTNPARITLIQWTFFCSLRTPVIPSLVRPIWQLAMEIRTCTRDPNVFSGLLVSWVKEVDCPPNSLSIRERYNSYGGSMNRGTYNTMTYEFYRRVIHFVEEEKRSMCIVDWTWHFVLPIAARKNVTLSIHVRLNVTRSSIWHFYHGIEINIMYEMSEYAEYIIRATVFVSNRRREFG